jgi:hypothetical protein
MMKFAVGTVSAIAATAALAYALIVWAEMPDVHVSYASGLCVEVVNYGTDYTCDSLPSRFNHVWVQ